MNRHEILDALRTDQPRALEDLWRRADAARAAAVGDAVHLRGLVEVSNHCTRRCAYCGVRAPRTGLPRYRMTAAEILACAQQAAALGYGTVVLQAGEDDGLARGWVADVIRRIKALGPLAVTLSLGERPDADLAAWRDAGADRYLLRFETSDRALYDLLHPPRPGRVSDRVAMLRRLRDMGYEAGSGVMVGLPGQRYETLADDLELMRDLDLDMIGIGPYLPHPAAPLGHDDSAFRLPPGEQVPATELMATKVLALARLACPDANLPSTTALAVLNPRGGRETGLARGANVVMPNLTPARYRELYEIYPGKAGIIEDPAAYDARLKATLAAMGRTVGRGRGDSPRRARRCTMGPADGDGPGGVRA
jgi:biotin synthase